MREKALWNESLNSYSSNNFVNQQNGPIVDLRAETKSQSSLRNLKKEGAQ